VLPELDAKANAITGAVLREGGDTISIERRNAAFVTADAGFPVKTDAVRELIASSMELSFEEARTSDPARYADLGLADPGSAAAAGDQAAAREIILRTAGGQLADFMVGNRDNTVGGRAGGVFVRLKGQPHTWLARGKVRLPSNRSDWFAPLDLNIKRAAIKKIELSGGGRDAVTAAANAAKPGELALENVPEKRVPDTFKVGRLATLIANFAFQDVRKRSKPTDDPRRLVADAEREKASAIAAKVDGFDFRLPVDRTEILGWTNAELTTEQKSCACRACACLSSAMSFPARSVLF
jgi:uncharacterized protein DUF4340